MKIYTIRDLLKDYFVSVTTDSTHLRAAKTQALSLFQLHLAQTYKLSPTTLATNLTPDHALSFLTYLQESRSIETEHLYSRIALNFYQYLSQQAPTSISEQDFADLTDQIGRLRRRKLHKPPKLSLATIQRIIATAQTTQPPQKQSAFDRHYLQVLRDKALILVMAETGLRVSEVCNLHRYQFANNHLTLALGFSLPLTSSATMSLDTYLSERASLDNDQSLTTRQQLPLFARHDKRASKRILAISRWTIANIIDDWFQITLSPTEKQAIIKKGLKISPHTFRHYFVVSALTQTEDIAETMRLSRHKDPATTRQYLSLISSNSE